MDLSTRKYLNEEATTQTRSEAWFGKTSRWFTCFSLQTDLLHVLHWSVLALWVTLHRDLLRWKGECVQNLCIFTQMFMIYYSDLLYFYCLPADVICCPFFFVISLNKAQVNHWQWECVNFFLSLSLHNVHSDKHLRLKHITVQECRFIRGQKADVPGRPYTSSHWINTFNITFKSFGGEK